MNFIKKHYEKVLLGLMLFGLIGVLIFMLLYIASDKSEMAEKSASLIYPPVKQLPDLDTSAEEAAMARAKAPFSLDLETGNKLFNPMEWQKALDGTLIPAATKTGLQVAVVTGINPLYTIISLDSVITNILGAEYVITVERQMAPTRAKRLPMRQFISVGDKANDGIELVGVKGAHPEDPDGLVLKLTDTGEVVTISKDNPYRHVDGYAADFRYDPEKKVFRGRRVGDKFSFGGVDYEVVGVNKNELILTDLSNQKNTSLPFVP
jgi:hypothetical protein